MSNVLFPIPKFGDQGDAVAKLHGLLDVLELKVDPDERKQKKFGTKTQQLIREIQTSLGLSKPAGEIDAETAAGLGRLVNDAEIVKELKTHSNSLSTVVGKLDVGGPLHGLLTAQGTKLDAGGALHAALSAHVPRLDSIVTKLDAGGALHAALSTHVPKLDDIVTKLDAGGALHTALSTHVPKLDAIVTKLDAGGALHTALSAHVPKLDDIGTKLGKLVDPKSPTEPLGAGQKGRDKEVRQLHDDLKLLNFAVPTKEYDQKVFGVGTRSALLKFQTQWKLRTTGVLDDPTHLALARAVADAKANDYRLEGRIFFENGSPAAGLKLRLYGHQFGSDPSRLEDAETNEMGFYVLTFSPNGKTADIELRALRDEHDVDGLRLSLTKFSAKKQEVLNLVAPAELMPKDSEYSGLTAALTVSLGGRAVDLGKLAGAREDEGRQDLSLLHRETGWDARLIALAAHSTKLSKNTKLMHEAMYGLLRMGLPGDERQLFQLSDDVIGQALQHAAELHIIGLNNAGIDGFKKQFADSAKQARLAYKAHGTLSSFSELLENVGLKPAEKSAFEDLLVKHRGKMLWQVVKEKLPDPDVIMKLRRYGKLAYLTHNNAFLCDDLNNKLSIGSGLEGLVDLGLYSTSAWVAWINRVAGEKNQPVEQLIPASIKGADVPARLNAYGADLARKVRLAYPTRVVACKIEKSELPKIPSPVAAFLKLAQTLGFDLGRTPLTPFWQDHEKIFSRKFEQIPDKPTIEAAKRLQRLYQITPSDEGLRIVLDLGFSSAQDISALRWDTFSKLYLQKVGSEAEARLIYAKAQQVCTVAYSMYADARLAGNAASVAAIATPQRSQMRAPVNRGLLQHPVTLESLFGSQDYCDCENCRSVLGPAAYLVDLFQFLDPADKDWEVFLADWESAHRQPYQSGWNDASQIQKKPFHALTERRPDLPHLPLTCENTNTTLPYIDLVNEILEYWVAHDGQLDDGAAHDTCEATSAELTAEPQYVLPEAYGRLLDAKFPATLPFDLWLETTREFLGHFDTSLAEVMAAFRKTDGLWLATPRDDKTPCYAWAEVFIESLGMSPAERKLFARDAPLGLWPELFGYKAVEESVALGELRSARLLSRKLGISYQDVVDIVKSSFVNPGLDELSLVWRLGLQPSDIVDYFKCKGQPENSDAEAFERRLETYLQHSGVTLTADEALLEFRRQHDEVFKRTLVLRDASASCDFDETTLQYAAPVDPEKPFAVAADYLRLNLFVRVWKKLGWTIDETDRALSIFLGSVSATHVDFGRAFETSLVYLAHLKELDERFELGKGGRQKLLTFWADLPATGKTSLYAQLFLSRGALKNDPVFDDPFGRYLRFTFNGSTENVAAGNVGLKNHLAAVQGALNLTYDEIVCILEHAGINLDGAALSLRNVSLIYRHGLLARMLKLTVADLVTLIRLSGLKPLQLINAGRIDSLSQDLPYSQTLRFVDLAESVRDSGFSIPYLDYLLSHSDPASDYTDCAKAPPALVKAVATGIRDIQNRHPLPRDVDDPLVPVEEKLREELGLIMPAEVVDKLLAMVADDWVSEVIEENVAPQDGLDPTDFMSEPRINTRYSELYRRQHLSYRGTLTDLEKARIKASHPLASTALNHLLATLLDKVQFKCEAEQEGFFDQRLSGFLLGAKFENLIAPYGSLDEQAKQNEKRRRRADLTIAFIPYLKWKLTQDLVVQTISATLGANPLLIHALVTDPSRAEGYLNEAPGLKRLLDDPTHPAASLVEAFGATGETGVTLTCFATTDCKGDLVGLPFAVSTVDTTGLKLLPGTRSLRFEGEVEVPVTGAYRFYVYKDNPQAKLMLRIGAQPEPLIELVETQLKQEASEVIELKAGISYPFVLEARELDSGGVRVLVESAEFPKGPVSNLMLYPQAILDRFQRAWVLLAKVHSILDTLKLNDRETRYLLRNSVNLSKLPTNLEGNSGKEVQEAFRNFMALADYARLRGEMAAGTDGLIDVIEKATAKADLWSNALATLIRRDTMLVKDAADALGLTAINLGELLRSETLEQTWGLQRLWNALGFCQKIGVSPADLQKAAGIVAVLPGNASLIARDLRNAIKARYQPETWQAIAQPIFDRLRRKQRDALVAYILHRHPEPFENANQLFEYFLIDPGMEPVVQTSRVRLAISSVQLFVQRCLLNMESHVSPVAINAKHWDWMRRYRVWEANRKVFLFPENWLEPEFRDDKTHLFRELEGALLQGDVSNDLAEDAFYQYLIKLEVLARLEIVTFCREEKSGIPAETVLHVIGRTYNQPHQYFYRRHTRNAWTPWEPVSADIDGNHIVAVVWRDRLHLFWLTFLDKPQRDAGADDDGSTDQPLQNITFGEISKKLSKLIQFKNVDVQLNWASYAQGEWSSRASGGFGSQTVKVPADFTSKEVFVHVSKIYEESEERSVLIHLHFDRTVVKVPEESVMHMAGVPPVLMARALTPPSIAGISAQLGSNLQAVQVELESQLIEVVKAVDRAFEVVNKNGHPEWGEGDAPSTLPYSYLHDGRTGAEYLSKGELKVTYEESEVTAEDQSLKSTVTTKAILEKRSGSYSLVPPANPAADGPADLRGLDEPFFYQDAAHTYLVEPTLTEQTIETWEDWGVAADPPDSKYELPEWVQRLEVAASARISEKPSALESLDVRAKYGIHKKKDWLTDQGTVLQFGAATIGQGGGVSTSGVPTRADALDLSTPGSSVGIRVVKMGAARDAGS